MQKLTTLALCTYTAFGLGLKRADRAMMAQAESVTDNSDALYHVGINELAQRNEYTGEIHDPVADAYNERMREWFNLWATSGMDNGGD